jgi:hypothetical protein
MADRLEKETGREEAAGEEAGEGTEERRPEGARSSFPSMHEC